MPNDRGENCTCGGSRTRRQKVRYVAYIAFQNHGREISWNSARVPREPGCSFPSLHPTPAFFSTIRPFLVLVLTNIGARSIACRGGVDSEVPNAPGHVCGRQVYTQGAHARWRASEETRSLTPFPVALLDPMHRSGRPVRQRLRARWSLRPLSAAISASQGRRVSAKKSA